MAAWPQVREAAANSCRLQRWSGLLRGGPPLLCCGAVAPGLVVAAMCSLRLNTADLDHSPCSLMENIRCSEAMETPRAPFSDPGCTFLRSHLLPPHTRRGGTDSMWCLSPFPHSACHPLLCGLSRCSPHLTLLGLLVKECPLTPGPPLALLFLHG